MEHDVPRPVALWVKEPIGGSLTRLIAAQRAEHGFPHALSCRRCAHPGAARPARTGFGSLFDGGLLVG
jgi:hypothetical protein